MSLESMVKFIEESNLTQDEKMELFKMDLEEIQKQILHYTNQALLIGDAIERLRKANNNGK